MDTLANPGNSRDALACPHSCHGSAPGALTLIALGNDLRGDDGIAQMVCSLLHPDLLSLVCYFDLGTHSIFLPRCLVNHRVAVVVDAINTGAEAGTVKIVNLRDLLARRDSLFCTSSHGLSFVDELRLAPDHKELPETLLLFGIETAACGWNSVISSQLQEAAGEIVFKLEGLLRSTSLQESFHSDTLGSSTSSPFSQPDA